MNLFPAFLSLFLRANLILSIEVFATDTKSGKKCHRRLPTSVPTSVPTSAPTSSPTSAPTSSPTLAPVETRTIPNRCEVELLMDLLENAISESWPVLGQWVRASFNEAGTYNQQVPEGGANGCLINHAPMRQDPVNNFLDEPLTTLVGVRQSWQNNSTTCVEVSSADLLQFAAFYVAVRQIEPSEWPDIKKLQRKFVMDNFQWGRLDEANCDTAWTNNLPMGFVTGTNITERITSAGEEIKNKMMDRNGFTPEQVVALMGAHSMGFTRSLYRLHAWVLHPLIEPDISNNYHDFLINSIVANDTTQFATNQAPLFSYCGDANSFGGFTDDNGNLFYYDHDLALAFPSLDSSRHPSFNGFSQAFADREYEFFGAFLDALKIMGELGVTATLSSPGDSACGCTIT